MLLVSESGSEKMCLQSPTKTGSLMYYWPAAIQSKLWMSLAKPLASAELLLKSTELDETSFTLQHEHFTFSLKTDE